ncbi:MAG: CmpA/NrtA family ABC transporter substrate-binding protein [Beijerinckiaceae bacterium]|jgi:NitT/TauT family transport system ATP-binding protein/nitrate/nitrite transport system substrate-binding protein
MSGVVSIAGLDRPAGTKLRIGFLRLTDSAPAIVAHEFGFFASEGVDTELVAEPSWANIADKLAYGFIDAAVIVPPLAFAVELGVRGACRSMIMPCSISLGGNTITLESRLAARVRALAAQEGLSTAKAFALCLREQNGEPLSLGIVHAYSTHNLLLRYWLTSAGIDPERDVRLIVVPPALAVDALKSGRIAGFCAGSPWGNIAARAGIGSVIATSNDIWQNGPEKAFAVRKDWSDANPHALAGAIRALLRAAQFCDAPENASYTASLLSRRKYIDADSHAIMASLPGGSIERGTSCSTFFRHAATFPWTSHGLWFLREMKRWNLIAQDLDLQELAARVYRPDLYRIASLPMGIGVPLVDMKSEGTHSGDWQLDASPALVTMGSDRFCDGAVFEPASIS